MMRVQLKGKLLDALGSVKFSIKGNDLNLNNNRKIDSEKNNDKDN
jgi:hypothetical protein